MGVGAWSGARGDCIELCSAGRLQSQASCACNQSNPRMLIWVIIFTSRFFPFKFMFPFHFHFYFLISFFTFSFHFHLFISTFPFH